MARSAADLLGLLQVKHAEDICVSECKDGPSQMVNYLRMDLWTMRRSWTDPRITAYEIKISRSDYRRGSFKLDAYLPYCQQLYVVCPWKMLEPSEMDDDVGLMYASKTGSKLLIKKRAPRRVIAPPENVFKYILITRTQIRSGMWDGRSFKDEGADTRCPRCGCVAIDTQNLERQAGPLLDHHTITVTESVCQACSRRWS